MNWKKNLCTLLRETIYYLNFHLIFLLLGIYTHTKPQRGTRNESASQTRFVTDCFQCSAMQFTCISSKYYFSIHARIYIQLHALFQFDWYWSSVFDVFKISEVSDISLIFDRDGECTQSSRREGISLERGERFRTKMWIRLKTWIDSAKKK